MTSSANPLTDLSGNVHESIPFSKIQPAHFDEAFPVLMERTRREIDRIAGLSAEPTFENTAEALSRALIPLGRIRSVLSNLNSAATTPALQKTADRWMPEISVFYNRIYQNDALFARIRSLYEQKEKLALDDEAEMLLDTYYKSFVHSGALLDEKGKKRLAQIKRRLSKLGLEFQKNLLHDTEDFQLHLTRPDQVEGLPDDLLRQARERARKTGKEGWLFGLQYPSYGPFMKYARRRNLRKKMYLAYMSRAYHGDRYDNTAIVGETVRLRKEYASLLGYRSYAALVLEERMAQTPEKVIDFLDELYRYARPQARKEFELLQNEARRDGIDRLQAWDTAYYSEKLKRRLLDLDDEQLKPYFELENTVRGLFAVAGKLYGIRFEPAPDIDVYHPDVRAYRVWDHDGSFLALFYADFYAREGKRQGAWMTSYKAQYQTGGQDSRPHISIVTNFARPIGEAPVLLNFYEVNTLFHEFGHALHGMFARTRYPDLSGTNVYWDFVELPSQIMENWTYEPQALALFARHYRSDEPLPQALIDKIRRGRQFLEGLATLRQLSFGTLDMAWHHHPEQVPADPEAFENRIFEPFRFTPPVAGTLMSTQFGHLFAGGYAAGYYSYKWSELLDADAFAVFQKKSIFDRETARKFRRLLEQGGSKHPMKLYLEFAGRPPQIDALVERAGFKQQND